MKVTASNHDDHNVRAEIFYLHECQATLDGARMGLGVCGREPLLLPPPLLSREGAAAVDDEGGSLLKVRPLTLVSASRSSRGTVSALEKDDS